MMNTDFDILNKQIEQFCSNPNSLYSNEGHIILNDLLKLCFYEKDFSKRNKIKQFLNLIRRSSKTVVSDYGHILHTIAFEAYEAGDIDYAEYLFRSACDLVDDNSFNNNLAYVIRRKNNTPINSCEAITLLLPGIQEREPFCLINMGLLFALNLSTMEDWKTADKLFALLPDDLNGADTWWEILGKNSESEGFLVHLFLLRHRKIEHSSLGTIQSIYANLKKNLDVIPEWLANDNISETVDDVID